MPVTELRPGQQPPRSTETTPYAFVLTLQVSVYSGRGFMLHERSGTTQVKSGDSRNSIFCRLREEAIRDLRAQGYEGSVSTLHWSLERDTLL